MFGIAKRGLAWSSGALSFYIWKEAEPESHRGCAVFLYMEGGGTRKPWGALYCYIWKEAEPESHWAVGIMPGQAAE